MDNSIVDYMNSLGVDSSYAARKQLFSQVFGGGYVGSAMQNIKLLNFIKSNYGKESRNEDFSPSPLFDNRYPSTSSMLPNENRMGKLKEYISLVNRVAQINPNDPMLPQYRQFIRSQINEMTKNNAALSQMIK